MRLDAGRLESGDELRAAMDSAEPDEPDEMVEFDAVFATEDPWPGLRYMRDPRAESYRAVWTQSSLTIDRKTISAKLSTPSGVPGMFNHFTWGAGIGRVLAMRAQGGELRGAIALSTHGLASYGITVAQLAAGMNAGLSIGATVIDAAEVTWPKGDAAGTFDRPVRLRYKRLDIREASLTATPMIKQAGLVGRRKQETTDG